jgi:hypothetical protein
MPNGIKYNVSAESLALKKGNFYIATGDVGKGPTSTSGFYNGVTPQFSGYVIYVNKASNGPSIYVAANDSELITITNKISGSNYSTVNQCLSYFAEQTDKIVLNKDYESTITDGLIYNVDAGFTPSYPRNGTTLYDNSVSGYNSAVYNSPTWESGGWFAFDGTDDYIDTGQTFQFTKTGQFSVSGVINVQDHSGRAEAAAGIIGKGHWWSNSWDVWLYNNESIYFETNGNSNPSNYYVLNSDPLTVGRWYFFTATYNNGTKKLYVNTSTYTGSYPGTGDFTNSNTVLIARRYGDSYRSLIGAGSKFSIYNRELSASEVMRNYYEGNTTTDSMVLFLDGNNIVSYPKTGTVWYDMTSSNYSVTGCNLQKGKNGRFSLFSDGNNPEIATSAILNNDYHTIEMVLMFKNTGDYPNGWTGGWEQFFGYYSGGSDRSPGVWRYPSERRIHWRYDPGNSGVDFGKNLAGDQFDLNTYYHVLVTKNGGVAEAWVNGTFVNSNGVSSPKTSGNAVVRFFDYYSSGLMEIQVCKIYNRVLTNQEIYTNYNSLANRL